MGQISMAPSNGGELLSVQLIHKSTSPFYWTPILLSWRVYHLASSGEDTGTIQHMQHVSIDVESNTRLLGHWFSPDNELWVSLQNKSNREISLEEYCQRIRAPSW